MIRIFLGLIVGLTLAYAQSSLAELSPFRLSSSSYGGIAFGESLEKAEARLGEKFTAEDEVDEMCFQGSFAAYPGVLFMVEEGKIVRGEVFEEGVATVHELQVGHSLKALKKSVSPLVAEEDPYSDTGKLMTSISKDQKTGYVFQVEGGKITGIRAGLVPAVQLVEGCL